MFKYHCDRFSVAKTDIRHTFGHLIPGNQERCICVSRYSHCKESPSTTSFVSSFFVTFLSVSSACSLHGSPSVQKWYFALQACQQVTQVRHINVPLIVVLVVSRRVVTFPSDRLESSCDEILEKVKLLVDVHKYTCTQFII